MRAIYTKTKAGVFVYRGSEHRRTLRCPGVAGDGSPCDEQISQARLDPKRVRILGFEQKVAPSGPGPIVTVLYCMGCLKVWRSRSRWLGELVKQASQWDQKAALFRLPKPKRKPRP